MQRFLTDREHEALRLLAAGRTAREAALLMGVRVNTFHGYVRMIRAKLHARTRAQAVARGYEENYL